MVESSHVRINLPDRTYQASVRSEMRRIAESIGFTGHRMGELEIIIAELTSNISKHTRAGGYFLVRPLTGEMPGIEIISIDEGPGIRMASDMMKDGLSTTRTLGQGLGAIQRLASVFDIFSLTGWGTILLTRTYIKKTDKARASKSLHVYGLNVNKPGESVSGDAWHFIQTARNTRIMIIDGLGHGVSAKQAADEAIQNFISEPGATPTDQLHSLHPALKRTRGGVVNVVYLDETNNQLSYSGVGNISMKVISANSSKGCFSYNGIVGHIMPSVINNHILQWQPNDLIILHSDGISGRWDLGKYPGILTHHPLLLCAAIYKDHTRGTDDATVVVAKTIKSTK